MEEPEDDLRNQIINFQPATANYGGGQEDQDNSLLLLAKEWEQQQKQKETSKANTGVFFFGDIVDDIGIEDSDLKEDEEASLIPAKNGKKTNFVATQKIGFIGQKNSNQEGSKATMCKTLSKETLTKKIKDVVGKQTQEGAANKKVKKFIFKRSQERKSSLLNTQKIKPSVIIGANTLLNPA
jgi:hypothetical protein